MIPKSIKSEMIKYKSRTEFYKKNRKLYQKLWLAGKLKEYANQIYQFKPKNYWTKETILKELQKHSSRSKMWEESHYAIKAAKKLGILEEATSHFPPKPEPKPKRIRKKRTLVMTTLSNKELIDLADVQSRDCQTRTQFQNKNRQL